MIFSCIELIACEHQEHIQSGEGRAASSQLQFQSQMVHQILFFRLFSLIQPFLIEDLYIRKILSVVFVHFAHLPIIHQRLLSLNHEMQAQNPNQDLPESLWPRVFYEHLELLIFLMRRLNMRKLYDVIVPLFLSADEVEQAQTYQHG